MKPLKSKRDSRLNEFLTTDEIAQIRKMQNSPPLEMHLPQDCCQCSKRESRRQSTGELPTQTLSTFGGLDK